MIEPPLKICNICRGHGCDCCGGRGVGIPLDWLAEHGDEWEIVGEPGPERHARPRRCPVVDVELGPPCGKDATGITESGAVYCDAHSYMAAFSKELFFAFGTSEHERARRKREFRRASEQLAQDLADESDA